jgi:hypothetical protein
LWSDRSWTLGKVYWGLNLKLVVVDYVRAKIVRPSVFQH